MPWFLLYAYMFFHPMPVQQPMMYKPYPLPPVIVQPAPPPSFECRIIKYPTKTDPTMVKICP